MIKPALESELYWIDNHPEFYNNKEHQELVKTNITIRYKVNKLLEKLDKAIDSAKEVL